MPLYSLVLYTLSLMRASRAYSTLHFWPMRVCAACFQPMRAPESYHNCYTIIYAPVISPPAIDFEFWKKV